MQSAAVISSPCRGWLSPPPSHSCSHPLQPPLPPSLPRLSFHFTIPSHSHSALSIYLSELDRSGTLTPSLPYSVGRCHLSHRLFEPTRGSRHDRGRLALPCARRASVSRSPFAPSASPGSSHPTAPDPALLGLNLSVRLCRDKHSNTFLYHLTYTRFHFGEPIIAIVLTRYALDYAGDYAHAAAVQGGRRHSEGQQGRLELVICEA